MSKRIQRLPLPAVLAAVVVAALAALAWLLVQRSERVLFEAESPFQPVRVLERADGLRTLYTSPGGRQSALYPDRPLHLELAYTRVGMVGLALVPADARILFVGLGGGAMPTYVRHVLPDARIDVVEIDPVVVDVAQRWFGFRPDARLRVHTADGRAFIEAAAPGSWDLVVLDAFAEDAVPRALTTREFLVAVRQSLAPGGVVVSNLWTGAEAYRSMVATYQAVFPEVALVRVRRHAQGILVAAPAARDLGRDSLVAAARALSRRARLGFDLPELVRRGWEPARSRGARVLEDAPTGGGLE